MSDQKSNVNAHPNEPLHLTSGTHKKIQLQTNSIKGMS